MLTRILTLDTNCTNFPEGMTQLISDKTPKIPLRPQRLSGESV